MAIIIMNILRNVNMVKGIIMDMRKKRKANELCIDIFIKIDENVGSYWWLFCNLLTDFFVICEMLGNVLDLTIICTWELVGWFNAVTSKIYWK